MDKVVRYFKYLFSSSYLSRYEEVLSLVDKFFTNSMNVELQKPFHAREVHKVLFQVFPTKSLGSDGLPSIFFLKKF